MLISLFILLCLLHFDNHPKFHIISLAPMTNKEANEKTETSMEDATNFNSETYKTYFITIMKVFL